MVPLTRRALVLLASWTLLGVGCASSPEPGPFVPEIESSPILEPEVPIPEAPANAADVPRASPRTPENLATPPVSEKPDATPSALDLSRWPFGWLEDPDAARLGLPHRFWSEQRLLWLQALAASTPPSTAVRRLETVFRRPASPDEAFRAAWHLWKIHARAALAVEARLWLDRAHALRPGPVTGLERAWDQAFRLRDPWGARSLWAALSGPWGGDDTKKARLLRQHLFLGSRSLSEVGADGYVSTMALDRDDLWAGTWNGAVVRWSLATEALDLILAPGSTVAPIKLLHATGWFVYAFQDQSLLRYSKVTGTWRTFAYPPGWTGLRIQAVVADGQESLWVAYLGQGLWHWERGEWALVDEGGGGPFLNALAPDGAGGFWVGSKDRGLWRWSAGAWQAVPAEGGAPTDISVIEAASEGGPWAVGTWGEGTWLLEGGVLRPQSRNREYVVGAAWTEDGAVWGTLDEGLVAGQGDSRSSLGPLDGLPAGGVSALVTWQGRWIWGTMGQGLGWWSEHENSALLR